MGFSAVNELCNGNSNTIDNRKHIFIFSRITFLLPRCNAIELSTRCRNKRKNTGRHKDRSEVLVHADPFEHVTVFMQNELKNANTFEVTSYRKSSFVGWVTLMQSMSSVYVTRCSSNDAFTKNTPKSGIFRFFRCDLS